MTLTLVCILMTRYLSSRYLYISIELSSFLPRAMHMIYESTNPDEYA